MPQIDNCEYCGRQSCRITRSNRVCGKCKRTTTLECARCGEEVSVSRTASVREFQNGHIDVSDASFMCDDTELGDTIDEDDDYNCKCNCGELDFSSIAKAIRHYMNANDEE